MRPRRQVVYKSGESCVDYIQGSNNNGCCIYVSFSRQIYAGSIVPSREIMNEMLARERRISHSCRDGFHIGACSSPDSSPWVVISFCRSTLSFSMDGTMKEVILHVGKSIAWEGAKESVQWGSLWKGKALE